MKDKNSKPPLKYLDFQAEVGITKHNGGFQATDELLSLCHIESAREVLNVGCGIGVGSCYVAKKHGCHVVGVDISEKMIEWSRLRAKEEHIEDKVEFRTADVLNLPFNTNQFDLVMCESVIAFVEDKTRAIRECMRVTKPGGYVGINESYFTKELTEEQNRLILDSTGAAVPSLNTWQSLWEKSGLIDRIVRTHPINLREEIKGRIEWVGWRWAIRAWIRLLSLFIREPSMRESLKMMFKTPRILIDIMGYGIFTGQKSL